MPEKTIEERLQRVEDFQQIQNIMGRYAYYVMADQTKIQTELSTRKNPYYRIYFGEQGYWEGLDASERAHGGGGPPPSAGGAPGAKPGEPGEAKVQGGGPGTPGSLIIHAPICPVIEVAGDGKTAKGVWIGLGLLGNINRQTGEPEGSWEWDKYGVDFIKEDGKWKMWHHHIYRLLGWKVDGKWADQFKSRPEGAPSGMMKRKTDGPAIDDNPYTLDTVQRLVPRPPEPYETWADTWMY